MKAQSEQIEETASSSEAGQAPGKKRGETLRQQMHQDRKVTQGWLSTEE